jgi:eukaryotic-like serine/threonine-protein kinase
MPDSPSNADTSPGQSGQDVVGRMAGEYRLVKKLGEGGFGAVYEAEHPLLRRRAAVKVLHQVAGMDSDSVLRFISEAQAANHIRSRHIVDVFSFGKLPNGRHFYVMDLLDGEPLDRFLRREKQCDLVTTLQLLRPIAEALDAAHAAEVVHRDLKPQNLFLAWEPSGETVPKLLDFGMAKLLSESSVHTVSGVPIGTPLYMSPEQARGEKVDGRSDVYALGVLCHEMLTGRVPFTGESPLAVLVSHLTLAPPRLSEVLSTLPTELDEPVLQMLHKEAGGRPATAGAAIANLVSAAERAGFVIPAGMPHLPRPQGMPVSRPSAFSPHAVTPEPSGLSSTGAAGARGSGATEPELSRAPATHSWALWALLGALAVSAVYLGRSALQAPASGKAPVSDVTSAGAVDAPSAGGPSSASAAALPGAGLTDPGARAPAQPPVAAPLGEPRAVPPAPDHVELTLRGAPAGARVLLGDKPLGEAEQPLPLPMGSAPLELTVSAPGYESLVLSVVPDRDTEREVKLKKRASRPKPARIPSDLESPF